MKIIKIGLLCLCLMLSGTILVEAKQWGGIVPLHSTRADVQQLLGPPSEPIKEHVSVHNLETEVVMIVYASGPPCGSDAQSEWQVPSSTVVSITVSPKTGLRLSDLNIDKGRYRKTDEGHRPDNISYTDEVEGESIKVFQGEVISITYFPAAKDYYLRCPNSSAASNGRSKGYFYPMLDTYSDISFNNEKIRLDNFAIRLQQQPTMEGYIIVYAGQRARAGEARARAERAKNYLVNKRDIEAKRIATIDGGHQEDLTVELYIVPRGAPAPTATPTVDPSKVQIIRDGNARTNNRRSPRPRCKR